jgi:hypothetical protein
MVTRAHGCKVEHKYMDLHSSDDLRHGGHGRIIQRVDTTRDSCVFVPLYVHMIINEYIYI